MKKIFIAGHNGFLGKSIYNEFSKDKKYKIITRNKKILDLTNFNLTNSFFKKNKIDYVVNAAGLVGGIKQNMENQIDFLDINYFIQSNLIKSAYNNNVKKYINIASSCIYPRNAKQPLKEDYLLSDKFEPTNEGYALSKVCGVKLSQFYKQKYNFNIKSLFPCNLYGVNDTFFNDNSHFISGIISKIYIAKKNNKKYVKLWGSGKPKREIMLNSEAARAVKFFLEKDIKEDNINIGSGIDYPIKYYAQKIKKILNYQGKIIWDVSQPDGVKRKLLDVSIMNKYRFKHKYDAEKGLELVINNFLNYL